MPASSTKTCGRRLTPEHVDPGSWQLQDNETALAVRFTPEGSDLLELITGALAGYHLGIFVDGELVAAPRIQRAITDGTPVISGFPSQSPILAAVLNTAPLPVPLTASPDRRMLASQEGSATC